MVCKCSLLLWTVVSAFLLAVAFLPDTQTYFGFDIDIGEAAKLTLPESFSGPLLANRLLSSAEHLFQDEVKGPEAFAAYKGDVYTGLADGRIVQILPDRIRTVAIIDPQGLGAEQCGKLFNIGKCGHPLGIRFDSKGLLYVVDPFNGVWTVNVANGALKLLIKKETLNAVFLDDLVLIEKANGLVIYLTDVSTKNGMDNVGSVLAEHDRTGRLLSYDTETGKAKIEYENLPFPNGLELTDDKSAVLMVALTHRLVYKYHIKGPAAGKLVTLVQNLPGEPDNIKRSASSEETYWVALYTARNQHAPHFTIDKLMVEWPKVVRFAARLQRAIGVTLEKLGELTSCDCLRELGADVKIGYTLGVKSSKYGMIVEVDAEGRIVSSLHSPDGSTTALSEAFELPQSDTQRHFYLGSATNRFVGRLSVAKTTFRSLVAAQKAPEPVVVVVPKTTQKPTTTTTTTTASPKTSGSNKNQKVEL